MFNVGDKVRSLNGRLGSKIDKHVKGMIFEVERINQASKSIFYVTFLGKEECCYAEDFELVEGIREKAGMAVGINASDVNISMEEVAKIIKNLVQRLNKEAEEMKVKIDNVNHPMHYNKGKIEVIDYIEDKKLNFNLGNAVKYISRCNHKGRKVEDIKKAIWYLEREINTGLKVGNKE